MNKLLLLVVSSFAIFSIGANAESTLAFPASEVTPAAIPPADTLLKKDVMVLTGVRATRIAAWSRSATASIVCVGSGGQTGVSDDAES